MKNIYDIVIVWAWAAWLFTSINAPKNSKKILLEKNKNPWVKVLLSGWERANVSNMDIEPERDYFGQNTKALIWMFKKYNNYDTMWFFAENWVNIVEEDRCRLILESWDSRELLNLLLKKSRENNTEIKCDSWVENIIKKEDLFEIRLISWEKIISKKVVITSGWTSFSQVWTTWDWYLWAKNFGHTIISPQRWLCGLVTKQNFADISWVSTDLGMNIYDKVNIKKPIYSEFWPLLFTHFWVSWPIIFNCAVALGNYLNSINLEKYKEKLDLDKIPKNEIDDYIVREYLKENIYINLDFNLVNTPKRLVKFFELNDDNLSVDNLFLQDFRTWKEAKVTTWWLKVDELNNNLESKFVPWLYFAGEILDLTGKTWWFNLQQAWTTWYIVWKNLE